eukprot:scaffold994_cov396-Pavlova_lutheri.AAC.4
MYPIPPTAPSVPIPSSWLRNKLEEKESTNRTRWRCKWQSVDERDDGRRHERRWHVLLAGLWKEEHVLRILRGWYSDSTSRGNRNVGRGAIPEAPEPWVEKMWDVVVPTSAGSFLLSHHRHAGACGGLETEQRIEEVRAKDGCVPERRKKEQGWKVGEHPRSKKHRERKDQEHV